MEPSRADAENATRIKGCVEMLLWECLKELRPT